MVVSERTPLKATARDAFEQSNVEESRLYHDTSHASEGHQEEGGLLKPLIFGGLDGILTSFAIVAGAAGGRLSPKVGKGPKYFMLPLLFNSRRL